MFTLYPGAPLKIEPAVLKSKYFIFSCTHAAVYAWKGSVLQQQSWLLVNLENTQTHMVEAKQPASGYILAGVP